MKHRINVFSSVQIYVGCFGYIFCHRAVRFVLQCAIVEIQTVGQGRMWASFAQVAIFPHYFFHTAQITWQLDGAQYSEMFTFEAMVASHDMMISPPKRYNYRNPPGLFMYSPPHAQRTPKISSIKNCALLLYSLCRQFPKDIFQKYLWKMAGVCYI